MPQRRFALDSTTSTLVVHTRAEGLLARFAHDLELSTRALEGTATLDGDAWTAELWAPVSSLEVEGVLHGATLDRTVLSAVDRQQILTKMREDIFGTAQEVEAKASGTRRDKGDVMVSVGSSSMRAPMSLTVEESEGGVRVTGSLEVSIKGLGGKPIKGPLGAFRVEDIVKVRFEGRLVPHGD